MHWQSRNDDMQWNFPCALETGENKLVSKIDLNLVSCSDERRGCVSNRVKLELQPSYLSIISYWAYLVPVLFCLNNFGLKSQKILCQHIFITRHINRDLDATIISSISSTLFNDVTRDSIVNNFVIGVYCTLYTRIDMYARLFLAKFVS